MKMKVELTEKQIDELVKQETSKLTKELQDKLDNLRSKYRFVFIETEEEEKPKPVKTKLTKELFLEEYSMNTNLSEIGRKYGISAGYMSILKKKFLEDEPKKKTSKEK